MIAVFEGMLDPKSRKAVIAKGPFTVEVFENPDRPKYFRARMLPTHQLFYEMRDGKNGPVPVVVQRGTSVEVRALMNFRFAKRIEDWHEPETKTLSD